MTKPDVEALVDDLLATGEMSAETSTDLERIRQEHREGRLEPDEYDYLVALHARLTGEGGSPALEAEAAGGVIGTAEEIAQLRAQLAAMTERAERAESELARLRAAPDDERI